MKNLNGFSHQRAAAFVVLLTLAVTGILPFAPAHASISVSTCSGDKMASQESAIYASINQAQAESVAQPSVDANRGSMVSSFFGMVGVFHQSADCTPVIQIIKLGYSLSNSSGIQKVVTVTENPYTNSVVNATNDVPKYFGYAYNAVWSGYEYSNGGVISESGASWSEPTAAEAYSHECDLHNCDYAFWVGITKESGGSSGIVQTGTDSGLYCAFGSCTYYKYTWDEFAPSPPVNCFDVSYYDVINAKVYFDHGDIHGNKYFDAYIADSTNGQSCFRTGSYPQWFTYYAQFMGERPTKNGSPARLPLFSQLGMTGGYYKSGSSTVTIDSGWTYDWIMSTSTTYYSCNGQSLLEDICNGAVFSGSFVESWQTSDGT
jgi:hypothetical protein